MRAMRRLAAPAVLTALLSGVLAWPVASAPVDRPGAAPVVVDREPCPDSEFTCITLRVPRDHFASQGSTFEVTFGLLRATERPRRGVFVTATGGPGTSGLAVADGYTAALDPRIRKHYDIVFFDQRGIGLSEPLQCPEAALAFYTSPNLPTISRAEAEAYAADASVFAADCLDQAGVDPDDLPYFSTRQAVEDLEAFRAWLGARELDLYGESYGTQYVQTYAAAHPDRVRSLIIDGPVDLTLDGIPYYAEAAKSFESTLLRTLRLCADQRPCRRDFASPTIAGYDELAARLRDGPIDYWFVRRDGTQERRQFTLGDLETAATGSMYEESNRMQFQRALAWATRGQLLPLARLSYAMLGQDPDTLEPIPDPSWSDAMYYAVECTDYGYGTGSAADRVDQYLDQAEAFSPADIRMGSLLYGDLPCAHWPVHGPSSRPEYITDNEYPVFVVASTWDPITPYAGAQRLFRQFQDAYLISQPGGPHVLFGRGNPCPDRLITAFLLRGDRPSERRVECAFTGADPYLPNPATRVGGYRDALAAMTATDDELDYNIDYWFWDGIDPLRFGCLFGGWVRYRAFADGYRVQLRDCTFTRGLPLDGRAEINTTDGSFEMRVTSPGGTRLHYIRDADGNLTVTGTYRGQPVP